MSHGSRTNRVPRHLDRNAYSVRDHSPGSPRDAAANAGTSLSVDAAFDAAANLQIVGYSGANPGCDSSNSCSTAATVTGNHTGKTGTESSHHSGRRTASTYHDATAGTRCLYARIQTKTGTDHRHAGDNIAPCLYTHARIDSER